MIKISRRGPKKAVTQDTLNDRKKPGMRRVLVQASFALSLSAVAALGTGATLSVFSSPRLSQSDGVASGSVSLASDVSGSCSVSNMLPGAAPSACTLKTTYTGSVRAYLALNILVETQAGNGGTKLYNPPDGTHDLQVAVTSTSPTVTYGIPVSATTCPVGAPTGSTCYELDNELVSTTPFTASSASVTFSTSVSLPAGTTTGYRGGAAQIVLTAHVAQSGNNAETGCSAGVTCSTVHWS